MWYFAWILGLGLALSFGIVNAIWFEIREVEQGRQPRLLPVDPKAR